MIRFCDLREAYWLYPEGQKGPFAFIDTVTDKFIAFDGMSLFDDAEHVIECAARDTSADTMLVDRCIGLMPSELQPEDEHARAIRKAIELGERDLAALRKGGAQ